MTYYTGLARVARKTNYPVVEVKGWKTRGQGQMGAIKTIVPHHTAGPKAGNAPSLNVVTHGRAGLRGALSHYVLGRDGTIYVVAAGLTWHAGKVRKSSYGNTHAIGIEAENTGLGEKWSTAQLDSYVKLCAALVKEFKLSASDVRAHKEICSPVGRKPDPNFSANGLSMDEFRAAVKRGYFKKPAAPAPKPKPEAKPEIKPAGSTGGKHKAEYPDAAIATKGDKTAEWDAAWRELMIACDFMKRGGDLTTAMQRWLKKAKLYHGVVEADNGRKSVFGPMLVEALQAFLQKKGLYKGLIDGKRGAMTIAAEQKYLNSQRKYLK